MVEMAPENSVTDTKAKNEASDKLDDRQVSYLLKRM